MRQLKTNAINVPGKHDARCPISETMSSFCTLCSIAAGESAPRPVFIRSNTIAITGLAVTPSARDIVPKGNADCLRIYRVPSCTIRVGPEAL